MGASYQPIGTDPSAEIVAAFSFRPQAAPFHRFQSKTGIALQFHGISLISGQPATYHLETPHHPVGSMMLYTILYHSYIIVISC